MSGMTTWISLLMSWKLRHRLIEQRKMSQLWFISNFLLTVFLYRRFLPGVDWAKGVSEVR
ncbi:hypothetical protein HPP92_028700 [Vanilla planifolia]|uniref:Uncharacterized protein n=1 Tax=Vanilla planifolia TaxID=51239 RepID=A0A835P6J1_VANPL|nr:hypothetical protein HPP92_028700 [Vanilla planifolia]KAG0446745.1 hypothetical protein HPP92_028685 [Vanilla planifolia]